MATPSRIVVLTLLLITIYICILGMEFFVVESVGAMVLFPVVLAQKLPAPWNHSVLAAMLHNNFFIDIFSLIPPVLLLVSILLAAFSILKNSLKIACVASAMAFSVFVTYHCVHHYFFSYHIQ